MVLKSMENQYKFHAGKSDAKDRESYQNTLEIKVQLTLC